MASFSARFKRILSISVRTSLTSKEGLPRRRTLFFVVTLISLLK